MTRAVTRTSVDPANDTEIVERVESAVAVASGELHRDLEFDLHETLRPAALETVVASPHGTERETDLAFPVGEFEVTVWRGAAGRVQIAVEELQQGDDPEAVSETDARPRPVSD